MYQCVEAASLACVLVLIALVRHGQKRYGVEGLEEELQEHEAVRRDRVCA